MTLSWWPCHKIVSVTFYIYIYGEIGWLLELQNLECNCSNLEIHSVKTGSQCRQQEQVRCDSINQEEASLMLYRFFEATRHYCLLYSVYIYIYIYIYRYMRNYPDLGLIPDFPDLIQAHIKSERTKILEIFERIFTDHETDIRHTQRYNFVYIVCK